MNILSGNGLKSVVCVYSQCIQQTFISIPKVYCTCVFKVEEQFIAMIYIGSQFKKHIPRNVNLNLFSVLVMNDNVLGKPQGKLIKSYSYSTCCDAGFRYFCTC